MSDASTPHDEVLRRIGVLLARFGDERVRSEVESLVRGLLSMLPSDPAWVADSGQFPEHALACSRLALILHRCLAERPDGVLAPMCMSALADLGEFGLILLCERLDQGAQEPMRGAWTVAEFPESVRYALFNRVLSSAARANRDFKQYALDTLTVLGESGDAHEGLVALSRYIEDQTLPAFVLRAAFEGGAAGRAVESVITGRSSASLAEAARQALALDSRKLGGQLAELLSTGDARARQALPDVLAAVSGLAELTPALLKTLVALVSRGTAAGSVAPWLAMEAVIRMEPEGLGRIFALAFTRVPVLDEHLPLLAPLLPRRAFLEFLGQLDPEARSWVPPLVLPIIAEIDPHGFALCFNVALRDGGVREDGELGQLIAETERASSRRGSYGGPLPIRPAREWSEEKEVFGARLRGRVFQGLRLNGVLFERADLTGVRFVDCELSGCRFIDCDLAGLAIEASRLMNCRFASSRLSGAVFAGAWFEDAEFTGCDLSHSDFIELRASRLRLRATCLHGARLTGSELQSSEFIFVDLSGCELSDSMLVGAIVRDAWVADAEWSGLVFRGGAVEGLRAARSRALGFPNPLALPPELTDLAARCRAVELLVAAREAGALEPLDLHGATEEALAAKALNLWYVREDFTRRASNFADWNARRLRWARHRLGPARGMVLEMLPLLVVAGELTGAPRRFPVRDFVPTLESLACANELFGELGPVAWAGLEQPQERPVVEAVLTIGSTGSVAQTPTSDIDVWVCCEKSALAPDCFEELRAHLVRMEELLQVHADVETHFFLMDMEDVRRNCFGFSDGESSGSAQAALLKEEFYRTALHLAGRRPFWWIVPADSSDAEYERVMGLAMDLGMAEEFLDMGPPPAISPREYFGATLWQIVKALKRPFKSVMKFGLLERYMADGGGRPLCERIKERVHAGRRDPWSVDPYVALFREVAGHYARSGELETVDLVRTCFLRKTQMASRASSVIVPELAEEAALQDLYRRVLAEGSSVGARGSARGWGVMDHARHVALAARVNRFLAQACERVRDRSGEVEGPAITPEDMTRLGRSISAAFSLREHKIERLAFIEMEGAAVSHLHATAGSWSLDRPEYVLHGGVQDQATGRLKAARIRSGSNMTCLAGWLIANGYYRPGVQVRTDVSISPVTTTDLQRLLTLAHDFLRPDIVFEPKLDCMLEEERVVRALFVLNLAVPREQSSLREVDVLYATNWGELLCRTFAADISLLDDPAHFLAQRLSCYVPSDVVTMDFLPERAQCPGFLSY